MLFLRVVQALVSYCYVSSGWC